MYVLSTISKYNWFVTFSQDSSHLIDHYFENLTNNKINNYLFNFSPLIKDHWNDKVSVAKNLSNFGLTNNPSKSILTGFVSTQPQSPGVEIKTQNQKVSKIFIYALLNIYGLKKFIFTA